MKTAPSSRAVGRVRVVVVDGGEATERDEALAGEEPLQIRAAGPGQEPVDIAVTMRTPGYEEELAAGFLVTEGLVDGQSIRRARFELADLVATSQPENEITVQLPVAFDAGLVAARTTV